MSGFLASLLGEYERALERQRNRPFLRACMAACALAAVADGAPPSFGERIRVDQILETLEQLKVFDPHEGVRLFNAYCETILHGSRAGHDEALAAVREGAGDRETAELMVRLCLAVVEAEGETKLVEQIEIVMLCGLLGVEPAFTGLYTEASSPMNLDVRGQG